MTEELRALAARLPAEVRFGASSWNYPGWRGLVYHREYEGRGAPAPARVGEQVEPAAEVDDVRVDLGQYVTRGVHRGGQAGLADHVGGPLRALLVQEPGGESLFVRVDAADSDSVASATSSPLRAATPAAAASAVSSMNPTGRPSV